MTNIGFAHLDLFGWLDAFSSGPNTKKSEESFLIPPPRRLSTSLHIMRYARWPLPGQPRAPRRDAALNISHFCHFTDHTHDGRSRNRRCVDLFKSSRLSLERTHHALSNILPGFSRPCGSRAFFTVRMSSKLPSPSWRRKKCHYFCSSER